MRAPAFWTDPTSVRARLLAPLAGLYDAAGRVRRRLAKPARLPVPVICVGNVVAGGAGKTPTALALGAALAGHGRSVHFLSRGYGGRQRGPVQVDPARHGPADVGDEPLLLAAAAPTWVAADRPAGGAAAVTAGAEVVVMDDGLQNPTLHQDLPLLVVDAGYLFGNGRVIPAGPLRERLDRALDRAAAVVVIGEETESAFWVLGGMRPTLTARLRPDPAVAAGLAGQPVFALAGIGRPQKFFDTLAGLGAEIRDRQAFDDHHAYTESEIAAVIRKADALGAIAVTTAKDAVRLPPVPALRDRITVLPVTLSWDDPTALADVLAPVLAATRHRDRGPAETVPAC